MGFGGAVSLGARVASLVLKPKLHMLRKCVSILRDARGRRSIEARKRKGAQSAIQRYVRPPSAGSCCVAREADFCSDAQMNPPAGALRHRLTERALGQVAGVGRRAVIFASAAQLSYASAI